MTFEAQLCPNLRSARRDNRVNQDSDNAERFGQVVHNSFQLFSVSFVSAFGQNPRHRFIDVFVGAANEGPYRLQRIV